MDIDRDLRSELLRVIPCMPPESRAELEARSTANLLILFFNWRDRLVHPHRRTIHRATNFNVTADRSGRRVEFDKLLGKLAAGVDVSSHLSRATRIGYCAPGKHRRDPQYLDLLLSDWGIHHLHVDEADASSGAFPRNIDALLFAVITKHAVYALHAGDHKTGWTNPDLVKIAVREWPDAGLFHKLHGIAQSPKVLMDKDQRKRLRRSRTNAVLQVDGEDYMPSTAGITSAGTSSRNTILSIRVGRVLDIWRNNPRALAAQMRKGAEAIGLTWPRRPDIRVRIVMGDEALELMFLELTTQAASPIER